MMGPVMARVRVAIFALKVLHSEGFSTCPIAVNFHAYSIPSALHQVEILRCYTEYLGMSTYLCQAKLLQVLPNSFRLSKVPCQWAWPFLSTGEHLSMIPAPTLVTLPSELPCMSIPTKVSTQCGCPRVWISKILVYVLHCVLACCHANINKNITCRGTTSHSRATAASAVEKSWPRAAALLAIGSYVSGQVLKHRPTVRQFKLIRNHQTKTYDIYKLQGALRISFWFRSPPGAETRNPQTYRGKPRAEILLCMCQDVSGFVDEGVENDWHWHFI